MTRSSAGTQTSEDQCAEARRQLIALIQQPRRRVSAWSFKRPTDIRYEEVRDPESGMYLTEKGMWHTIERFLKEGVRLRQQTLDRPAGEKAWVCLFRLAPDQRRIYVKLQMIGSRVHLRSFHYSDPR